MTLHFDLLAKKLVPYYSYFRVAHRLLFANHSHQAWPNACIEGQKEAFYLSANKINAKWEDILQKQEILRNYLRTWYEDSKGSYSFSANTHDLLVRLLSALPFEKKPKIITTDGEFYTIARQLSALAQRTPIEVVCIAHTPLETLAQRIEKALDEQVACILCSHVFFENAMVNVDVENIGQCAKERNIPLIIDDYHGANVVRLSLKAPALTDAYILGGGYKYLQWGEGNAYLRFPSDTSLAPIITGWYAVFSQLHKGMTIQDPLRYDSGNSRFAGATFEPTSVCRAEKTVEFFHQQQLTPKVLCKQYAEQIAYMKSTFQALRIPASTLQLAHPYPLSHNGGFLALKSPYAQEIARRLQQYKVYVDTRKDVIRFGPAPYSEKRQIDKAFEMVDRICKTL